jgi:hypothetical protein
MLTNVFALMTTSSLPNYMVRIMLGGIAGIVAVLLFAAPLHKRYHYTKKTFFSMICVIVISVTAAMIFTQSALISKSENGAINRRTGQMALFACDQQISIRPNSLLSSTAGNGSYSVTSDGYISFLGYETEPTVDATLGSFFQAIGGSISSNVATIPLNRGSRALLTNSSSLDQFSKTNILGETYLELRSGESCSVTPSMLSIYVYSYNPQSRKYEIRKIIQHPELYVLNDRTYDKRDCIVLVFGDPRENLKSTCNGYPNTAMITPIIKELSL